MQVQFGCNLRSGAPTACALVEKRGERSARDKAHGKKMRRGGWVGDGGRGKKEEEGEKEGEKKKS
jgi:hypothetical protein